MAERRNPMLVGMRGRSRGSRQAEHARTMENRLLDLRAGLALLLGCPPEEAETMSDTDLLETAAVVIRRAQR